jgi:hypothetical protein
LFALAVHFRGGRDENRLAVARSAAEHAFGADDVIDQTFRGFFDDQTNANRSRQVIDAIRVADQFINQRFVPHIVDHAAKAAPCLEVFDIGVAAGREIIDHDHFFPTFGEVIRKM